MNARRWMLALVAAVAAAWWLVPPVEAGDPLAGLFSFARVEAHRDKAYPLTDENGPWLIMACSFSGEGAEQQAQELVYELRKKYNLPAYTYQMHFDFGERVRGRGIDEYGRQRWMKPVHAANRDEIAVLVGDFLGAEDPDAQKTLERIKYNVYPDCLKLNEHERTNRSLGALREIQREIYKVMGSERAKRGPLGRAQLTKNPLLPDEYFQAPGLDPLVLEINENVEHSLLKCPGKYTVQVATFRGKSTVNQKKIRRMGDEPSDALAEAAMNAHLLTIALRHKGYDAYEFHDRKASIVTVGSFDSIGSPRPDGKIEINPKIYQIMKQFGGEPTQGISAAPGAMYQKTLVGIPFDVQPKPVYVPKRSVASQLRNDRFTGLW